MLQYYNWIDNQVKTEFSSYPVGQKSILKIVKLTKMTNFSVESGSESSSISKRPLRDHSFSMQGVWVEWNFQTLNFFRTPT